MRIILVATAAAAILSGGSLLASRADAMTLAAPAGMRAAIQETSPVENTAYVCWRRGWHRVCSWRPAHVWHRPYHRSYAYAPIRHRWSWRHRW